MLLNQLICKFSTSVHDIVDEVFPAIASRVFSVLPQDAIPCGPGGITEVWLQWCGHHTLIALMFIFHSLIMKKVILFHTRGWQTGFVYRESEYTTSSCLEL